MVLVDVGVRVSCGVAVAGPLAAGRRLGGSKIKMARINAKKIKAYIAPFRLLFMMFHLL
jgi:hypothetical protein